ncbi:MAG: hypothetical protein E5X77_30405 [Mesorhizobium sp.]|nr:MAG: hypothetical protein E5X77_30405 [Mesorhizobium sp.]
MVGESRLIPQADMSARQIIDTSYDLLAVLQLIKSLADAHNGGDMPVDDVAATARAMALAIQLHAPLHDALETHEGAK